LIAYDAADELPPALHESFDIAMIDPPWYPEAIYTFLFRALAATHMKGEIYCTLPGRLTRPGIESFRAELARDIISAGHEILVLEEGTVHYQVPRFELAALKLLEGFKGVPWRTGDLLHIRKTSDKSIPPKPLRKETAQVFSRNSTEFRVFLRGTETASKGIIAQKLDKYSENISTRAHTGEVPDLWTSEKVGILMSDLPLVRSILECWANDKLSKQHTVDKLVILGKPRDLATEATAKLDGLLFLWSKFAAAPPLRLPDEIKQAREAGLTAWATRPTAREHNEKLDLYRGEYQRDRDRVLWSSGLRRLSDKTQLFPVEHDDDLRQRLAHSLEVFQLAATIGASFGLDSDLIEAGSLAHDIGHTPFGHAGEHALDKLLNTISEELGGFNHYEHGVDVVRYLEGPYYTSPTTPFYGLNLTSEVLECVIKHTYCHRGESLSTEEIAKKSKHNDLIEPGFCHLEGQAVRAADKISYLISDLEDGIRLGVLTNKDLLSCRFFHAPPLDFTLGLTDTLHQCFLQQRRWILKLLMEDILNASSKRISRLSSSSPNSVREAGEYTIQHSEEILHDVEEMWTKLQAAKLHTDRRVVSANLHASRIVAELCITYCVMPELIEKRFRSEHERLHTSKYMKHYREKVGKKVTLRRDFVGFLPMNLMIGTRYKVGEDLTVPIESLIMAKDFVAALSDSRATAFHEEIVKGKKS
jgi:dGTPase